MGRKKQISCYFGLIFIFAFCFTANAGFKTDVLEYSKTFRTATPNISTVANLAQLDSAIARLNGKQGTIEIIDTITLTGNRTIPATCEVRFNGRGYINGAYMFTINSLGNCSAIKIFDTLTSVTINSSVGGVINSTWWGNNQASIRLAISSMAQGMTLLLDKSRIYDINTVFPKITKKININGNGATIYQSVLLSGNVFTFSRTDSVYIKNLNFIGKEVETGFVASSEADIYGAIIIDTCKYVTIENITASKQRTALRLQISNNCKIVNLNNYGFFTDTNTYANYCPAIYVFGGYDNTIQNCSSVSSGSIVTAGKDTKNLKILQCNGSFLYDNGVYISSGFNCLVSHCTIKNVRGNSGIKMRGSGHIASNNNIISSIVGISMTGNGSTPDEYNTNGHSLSVIANSIDSVNGGYGISIGSQDGFLPRDIVASNNIITNTQSIAGYSPISIQVKSGANVCNNTVDSSNTTYGITLTGGVDTSLCNGVIVANNFLSRLSGKGLYIAYANGAVISGNIFNKVSSYGIEGRYLTGSVISGNTTPKITDGILLLASTFASDSNIVVGNYGSQNITSNSTLLNLKWGGSSLNTKLTISDTTSATSYTTGSLIASGASFSKNLFVLGKIFADTINNDRDDVTLKFGKSKILDTTTSINITTGSLVASGGAGIAKQLYVGNKIVAGDTVRVGSATASAQLDSVSGVLLEGNATVWDDMDQFDLAASKNRGATGAPPLNVSFNGFNDYQFGINDSMEGMIEMTHKFMSGDTMFFHAHVMNANREVGNKYVNYSLKYLIKNIGDTITYTGTGTYQDTILSNTPAGTHRAFEFPVVAVPNVRLGAIIKLIIKRIAASPATDPTNGPFIMQIGCHRKIDTMGSRQKWVK